MTSNEYRKKYMKLRKSDNGLFEIKFPYTLAANYKDNKLSLSILEIYGYDAIRKMYKEFWRNVNNGALSVYMAVDFPACNELPYGHVGFFSYDNNCLSVDVFPYNNVTGKYCSTVAISKVSQYTEDINSVKS